MTQPPIQLGHQGTEAVVRIRDVHLVELCALTEPRDL